jgi:hypothetical protein
MSKLMDGAGFLTPVLSPQTTRMGLLGALHSLSYHARVTPSLCIW